MLHSFIGHLVECYAFITGAESLRFKSRAGKIGHSVANGLPRSDIFSKGATYVARGRNDAKMGTPKLFPASV